ncbi:hypothetical protein [Streptomyces sp. NPDC047976]|uniref:hypothetical protein n=1 Tax=unclassified Streptomyces TaxID=2593676 RepID=UPI003425198E
MPVVIPWQQRLSSGTEAVQDDVIRWYQETPEGQAYVPDMIWGTLQTEAYATVILTQVLKPPLPEGEGIPGSLRLAPSR